MSSAASSSSGLVRVRGAREHNLKNVDVDIPRDALVVFTGVSGSGKSSLAFGTVFAEAQRRYLDSISPYARRLIDQVGVPEVDSIEGLPPAVALQQARGAPSARSSVGSVTTISNSLRMLYSRAGSYPPGQDIIYADGFSPNTPAGACPTCHGLGRIYDATEATMVLDPTLSIRDRAVAAWPGAWHGQNQRDILTTLGHDVDLPWHKLPKKTRDWILYTDEQPVVPVYAGYSLDEARRALRRKEEPSYMGTFTSARRYVLHTFATTQSAQMKKRVAQYLISTQCPQCDGKRLRREALSVTFAGLDIGELSRRPLDEVADLLRPAAEGAGGKRNDRRKQADTHPEQAIAAQRIAADLRARIEVVQALGLGYLSLERSTPTLSPGELQRLRLATQIRSQLFGVVYVMDEPSAGLHPADAQALLGALDQLKAAGNSVFVVEHEVDVIRHADWIVDVGPAAGVHGGQVLYSGPPAGLEQVEASSTRRYLFGTPPQVHSHARAATGWLQLRGITRNNVRELDVDLPLGVFTTVTGVSGSGKSSLVSQALVELLAAHLGQTQAEEDEALDPLERGTQVPLGGAIVGGLDQVRRLVRVDQKPIGRTPRSNLATYTGLFDPVRKLFAATPAARRRRYDPGQFSFNVAKGRCATCEGEGSVHVELLFMPSVYAPCPSCHGARYNAKTLEIALRGHNIAQVLAMTVDQAASFFADDASVLRPLQVLREVGLGYLRLGQPATELSGGEAQRIKLATELSRASTGKTLYVLDEPTTGLHMADCDRLVQVLSRLADAGNTVLIIEHNLDIIKACDYVIDLGPEGGDRGGQVVVTGTPEEVARCRKSYTGQFLKRTLANGKYE